MSEAPQKWPLNLRIRKLLEGLEIKETEALILSGTPNVTYVTGLREPTGLLLLSGKCEPELVTSVLDYHRILYNAPRDLEVIAVSGRQGESIETDIIPRLRKMSISDYLRDFIHSCNVKKIYIDKAWTPPPISKMLESLKNDVKIEDASDKISLIRSIKDEFELDMIQKAIDIAEKALSKILIKLNESLTEADGAALIIREILTEGGWGTSFNPIVAFHENTAYPHHTPTTRRLGVDAPVLIDLGAVYRGYCSDMTRTTWYGQPPSRFKEIIESVLEAQEAAIDIASPGVEAQNLDNASRAVLRKKGLDRYFIHGLGHGVGVEVHERPAVRPGSKETLEPGMVITIEPGVYIPGLYGVRIEDMILITKSGARILTRFSRNLL
jgi:Xaa-Pro dipeptidase